MAEIHGEKVLEKSEEDKEIELKRSSRNKGKEDQKIEDIAKLRAEERDNYGMSTYPNVVNPSFLHISSLIGIDLGCSIEMVEKNLEAINKMEIARRELYLQNIKKEREMGVKNDETQRNPPDTPVLIDTGDLTIEELCSDLENSDADMEEEHYKHLRAIFSGRKNRKEGSPAMSGGKQSIEVAVLKKGRKKI